MAQPHHLYELFLQDVPVFADNILAWLPYACARFTTAILSASLRRHYSAGIIMSCQVT